VYCWGFLLESGLKEGKMSDNKYLENKMKKIGKLMGGKAVFRIGVDHKSDRIDLLSVDLCSLEEENESKKVATKIPDYIG